MTHAKEQPDMYDRRALLGGGAVALGSVLGASMFPHMAAAATAKTGAPSPHNVPVSLIGLPYLMGTRAENSMYGMAQGPVRMLETQNAPTALRSYFRDVDVQMIDNVDEPAQPLPQGDQMARILAENLALAQAVRSARQKGRLPILSIGTCSAALGIAAGLSSDHDDIGMIWIDAHADAETPDSTRNGFIEGMVVPMIAGQTWKSYSNALPGFRPIDESRIISVGMSSRPWPLEARQDGSPMGATVHQHAIAEIGIVAALKPALDQLKTRCKKVFIHMDADSIDPSYFRNFKFRPSITGMTPAVVAQAFNLIADQFEILAFDLSAFDPVPDTRGPSVLAPIMLEAAKAAARSRAPV